jgi:hypothetical protein
VRRTPRQVRSPRAAADAADTATVEAVEAGVEAGVTEAARWIVDAAGLVERSVTSRDQGGAPTTSAAPAGEAPRVRVRLGLGLGLVWGVFRRSPVLLQSQQKHSYGACFLNHSPKTS